MINKNTFTPAEGKILVDEFYNSNLKPGEFCQQKNIHYHVLQYWRNKYVKIQLKNNSNPSLAVKQKFVPINLVNYKPTSSTVKIYVNDKVNIELSGDFDVNQFKQILEACILCG